MSRLGPHLGSRDYFVGDSKGKMGEEGGRGDGGEWELMGVVCTIVPPPFFRAPFVLEPLIKPTPIGGGKGRGEQGMGGGVEVGGRRVMDKYEEAVLGAVSVCTPISSPAPLPPSSSSSSSSSTSVCSLAGGPPFCSFDLTPPLGGGGRMGNQKTMYSITQR